MNDAPQPGDRLRHTYNDATATVLGLRSVEWPTYLEPDKWVYVRFDNGVQNYVPIRDLAPERGCRDFAGRPDVGV